MRAVHAEPSEVPLKSSKNTTLADEEAVKFCDVTLAPLSATCRLVGEKVSDAPLGVKVYEPFASPEKLYAPDASAVVVWFAAPLSATCAPDPRDCGEIVPEIV